MNKDQIYSKFRTTLINNENLNNYQVNRLCGLLHNILYYTPEETPPASYKEAFKQSDDKIREKLGIKAKTDKVGTGLLLIPLYSLLDIGKIFIEGLRYGKDNWKKGVNDKEYQEERLEHAFLHLIKYKEGDRSEAHLAKVAWFCVTQLELERLENETSEPTR